MKEMTAEKITAVTVIENTVLAQIETPEGDELKEIVCLNINQAFAVEKLLKSVWGVRHA